jgi:hypothetical protein
VNHLVSIGEGHGGELWCRKATLSEPLLSRVKARIERGISGGGGCPNRELAIVARIDPALARTSIARALTQSRRRYSSWGRATLLAWGARLGDKTLVPELLDLAGKTEYEWLLLVADDDRALAKYLELLQGQKKVEYSRFSNQPRLSSRYIGLVGTLFPTHAQHYFDRVYELLTSDVLVEREGGEACLQNSLHWTFGFDARAFRVHRRKMLERLSPLFKKFSGLSEPAMRAAVLRSFGAKLRGEPDRSWLPELRSLAVRPTRPAAANALKLIETITEQHGAYRLGWLPPAERRRVLTAWLRDRGFLGR